MERVPLELMWEIFSYIPMDGNVAWEEDDTDCSMNQYMVLLRVCRQFRTAALESNALIDRKFNIKNLVPSHYGDRRRKPRIVRLLDALLADKQFKQNLARKRDWTFWGTPHVLRMVMDRFPTFQYMTQNVEIHCEKSPPSMLDRLVICRSITELQVLSPGRSCHLNLDTISDEFPCLRHLKIEILPHQADGSLNTRKDLISFMIAYDFSSDQSDDDHRYADLPTRLLPLASTNTIKDLRLSGFHAADLSPFHNLKHFVFLHWDFQWDSNIDKCMKGLSAYLETFVLRTRPDCLRNWAPIFESLPVFARLRILHLWVLAPTWGYLGRNTIVTHVAELFTEIASKSPDLQHLFLANVAMDLDNLQHLARLRKLRSIKWVMGNDDEKGYCIRGDGSPEEALGKVFESFETAPRIQVVTGARFDWIEEQVDSWPAHES
jgi:hypothetical protein